MARKQKYPVHKKVLGEAFFWFHTVVVLFMLLAGLIISFWWVLAITILHRLQLIAFHGCILTRLQAHEGGIKKGTAYYGLVAKRFFGIRLSPNQVRVLSLVISAAALVISLAATKAHFRLFS